MNASDRAAMRLAFALGAIHGLLWLAGAVVSATITLAIAYIARPWALPAIYAAFVLVVAYAVTSHA